jgi:hypothetical protein
MDRQPVAGERLFTSTATPTITRGREEAKVRVLQNKFDNERFLFGGLDSVNAVVSADPSDRLAMGVAGQDGEEGQGRSGAPVASEAPELHAFTGASPSEQRSQADGDVCRIIGDAEVRPAEVGVGPRWLPSLIKIEAEVRRLFTYIGVRGIEGCRSDSGSVGQYDH